MVRALYYQAGCVASQDTQSFPSREGHFQMGLNTISVPWNGGLEGGRQSIYNLSFFSH